MKKIEVTIKASFNPKYYVDGSYIFSTENREETGLSWDEILEELKDADNGTTIREFVVQALPKNKRTKGYKIVAFGTETTSPYPFL